MAKRKKAAKKAVRRRRSKTQVIARSAKSGKTVSLAAAKRRKATTVVSRVKRAVGAGWVSVDAHGRAYFLGDGRGGICASVQRDAQDALRVTNSALYVKLIPARAPKAK